MPKTIRGIGTGYYGASDRQPDGSFVTTEWIALVAPIIPLRSLRVHYLGKQDHGGRSSSEFYNVVSQTALDKKQVFQIYGLHLTAWIVVFLLLYFPGTTPDTASTMATIFTIIAIVFWIWVMPSVL